MTKRNKLIIVLCSLCVSLACIGIGTSQMTVSAQTEQITVETHGASVRTIEPAGLRFISSIPKSIKDNGTFGTLIIPKEILGEETLNHNADTADSVMLDYLDIQQTKWSTEAVRGIPNFNFDENREYFNAVMTEIPEAYYGTELVASAYALVDGVYYYSSPVTRSIGWVAAAALADGETGDFLVECVDNALADSTLAMEQSVLMNTNDIFTLGLIGNKGYAIIGNTSAEDVATVDKNGKITAVAEGKTVITAKLGSQTLSCSITVKEMAKGDSLLAFTEDNYESKLNANLYEGEGGASLAYSTDYVVAGQSGSVKITSNSFYTDILMLDSTEIMTYENVQISVYNPQNGTRIFRFMDNHVEMEANSWATIETTPSVFLLNGNTSRFYKDAGYGGLNGDSCYITDIIGVNKVQEKVVDFTSANYATELKSQVTESGNEGYATLSFSETHLVGGEGVVQVDCGSFWHNIIIQNAHELAEYKNISVYVYNPNNGSRTFKFNDVDFTIEKNTWSKITIDNPDTLQDVVMRLYKDESYGGMNGETFYISDIYASEKFDTLIDFTAEHIGVETANGTLTYDTTKTYGMQDGVLKFTSDTGAFYFDFTFKDDVDLTGYTKLRFVIYAEYNGTDNSGGLVPNIRWFQRYDTWATEGGISECKKWTWTVIDVMLKDSAELKGNKFRIYPNNWAPCSGDIIYIADIMGIK